MFLTQDRIPCDFLSAQKNLEVEKKPQLSEGTRRKGSCDDGSAWLSAHGPLICAAAMARGRGVDALRTRDDCHIRRLPYRPVPLSSQSACRVLNPGLEPKSQAFPLPLHYRTVGRLSAEDVLELPHSRFRGPSPDGPASIRRPGILGIPQPAETCRRMHARVRSPRLLLVPPSANLERPVVAVYRRHTRLQATSSAPQAER